RADGSAFRLAGNRDESRARPEAGPPVVRRSGSLDAIFPIDPVSGGTWIGVNTAGVAMTLLNIYPDGVTGPTRHAPPAGSASRGAIVPSLLGARSAGEASRLAGAIDPSRYAAFRLVVVDAAAIVEIVSDGRILRRSEAPRSGAPALFTSSGL